MNNTPNLNNTFSTQQPKSVKPQTSDFKLRLTFYGTICFIIIVFFCWEPAINTFNIFNAENCYKNQNYICAFKFYKNAFSTNINNNNYVEHYFNTLKKIEKVTLVQEELNKLFETYPDNKASSDIKEVFKQLQAKVLKDYPDTYIDSTLQGTNVIHWNTQNKKIRVFIDNSQSMNFPGYYIDEIKNAFESYEKTFGSILQFEYVNDTNDADIEVFFQEKISEEQCKNSDNCSDIMGVTENSISGYSLHKMRIRLRYKDIDNTNFTANQIYNIAKHEIGHAIGIAGHSYAPDDIMYPLSNDASWAEDARALLIERKEFSARDIKTIKLLYEIVPDITNKRYNVNINPNMYVPIAVLGTKKEIGEKTLEESQKYMSTVNTNFLSIVTLAEGYFSNKDYDKAAETFSSALPYAKTEEEKYTVYNNLSVIYYEHQDYAKAIEYAETANTYKANGSDEIIAYCYIEKKQYAKAQKILEELVKIYPENIAYSAALTGVYIQRYQFIKMILEMKRIKKVNTESLKDPLYQPYSFFSFLA